MIEVIKDKEHWDEQLRLIEHSDFYFTYDYHHLSKNDEELPILIKYSEGASSFILPLLIRPIQNTKYNDAISVYGYAGILAVRIDDHFQKESFHKELIAFFNEYKIVSVFSRLHPYLEYQESLLDGLGSISTLGPVVYIDLEESLDDQRKMFNRRMKTYLNTARKTNTVIESKLEGHLNTFIQMYTKTMHRVNADEQYFFDDKYFHQLMSSTDFTTRLLLNIHNETQIIIGGAIFIEKGPFVQYHLSALNDNLFDPSCTKLIIDEMRIKSTNAGFEYLNLGGGRGSQQDSLFAFKSCFSKKTKEFKIWKYIVDENVYKSLVKNHLRNKIATDFVDTNFFPAYRSKTKTLVPTTNS